MLIGVEMETAIHTLHIFVSFLPDQYKFLVLLALVLGDLIDCASCKFENSTA